MPSSTRASSSSTNSFPKRNRTTLLFTMTHWYPLLFKSVYMPVCWGGDKFKRVLGRELPDSSGKYGEAWDICDGENARSIVKNGALSGWTLRELVLRYGKDLIGKEFDSDRFPVMVKIIDAADSLSMQLHPSHEDAEDIGNGARGKSEMWYILQTDENAMLHLGLRKDVTQEKFSEACRTSAIEDMVEQYRSAPRDAFFVDYGCVHSIGRGNLLLEIQENSETTYRFYDWGRMGLDGKPRQLHYKEVMRCLKFDTESSQSGYIPPVDFPQNVNASRHLLRNRDLFSVEEMRVVDNWRDSTSFHVAAQLLTAVNGTFDIVTDVDNVHVPFGNTVLLPAAVGEYVISSPKNGTDNGITIIRTTIGSPGT